MTQDELLAFARGLFDECMERLPDLAEAFFDECLETIRRKNHDYAGASGASPFSNFELCELLGVCPTEVGLVVRNCDKVKRMAEFAKVGRLKVQDESIRDTARDCANYSVLFAAWMSEASDYAGRMRKAMLAATDGPDTEHDILKI